MQKFFYINAVILVFRQLNPAAELFFVDFLKFRFNKAQFRLHICVSHHSTAVAVGSLGIIFICLMLKRCIMINSFHYKIGLFQFFKCRKQAYA